MFCPDSFLAADPLLLLKSSSRRVCVLSLFWWRIHIMASTLDGTVCRRVLLDPRLIATLVAAFFMASDDLPGAPYGTFRDPGEDLLFSISLGQFVVLGFVRHWDRLVTVLCSVAFIVKLSLKGVFYVHNALLIDISVLFAVHQVIVVSYSRSFEPGRAAILSMCGGVGFVVALAVCWGAYHYGKQFGHTSDFWPFAVARGAFPYFFWTALQVGLHFTLRDQRREGQGV
jgi:hypothetical protein